MPLQSVSEEGKRCVRILIEFEKGLARKSFPSRTACFVLGVKNLLLELLQNAVLHIDGHFAHFAQSANTTTPRHKAKIWFCGILRGKTFVELDAKV
mmetsp:Transcript_11578/g.43219  ORF Transcript_11578/g.43219 Transcript_11578/m.43219 type:complete len:96 (-) Transcript_11578:393-680(-)